MGKVTRKRYSCEFKSRVALEAIRGEQTLSELASKHGVHQTMIAQWKRQAIEGMAATFSGKCKCCFKIPHMCCRKIPQHGYGDQPL
ncbi:transposase, partial [Komagataeibacter xylinus]|uniref:transposase n=1 Tax=Komagataeibacter xylinus TaxID=28448 RepID=UPI001F5FD66D